MDIQTLVLLLIIGLTVVTSIIGFNNREFRDRYIFSVSAILGKSRQWDRLLTSASLHGDWLHLIFNMWTLYMFSGKIIYDDRFGVWGFLAIYFLSILGGELLSLWVHRREYYYMALGASGGVVGVLFAAIAIDPQMGVGMFFIPFFIPGWIFGMLYLAFSIYGMQKSIGNIGHDAHLGGAAVGLVLAVALAPEMLKTHGWIIGLMAVPLIILAYFVWKRK